MATFGDLNLNFSFKEMNPTSQPGGVGLPGGSSTVDLVDNKLVCVEYPAVVADVDKMLDTVGGEEGVSKTYGDPNRRLELRFRSQDPFCHSLCGNRFPSSNLLLKIRRRVRRKDPEDAQIRIEILGVIGTTYKFQGMADFQYLAVHSEGGAQMSLYDKIILHKAENQQYFEQPLPIFLPPPIFSRLDSPVDYFYRPDIHHNVVPITKENFISLNRARRPHNAVFVNFTDPSVPSECLEAARTNWQRVCIKEWDRYAEEEMKKMFESRPIWSRNAVKANLDIHPEKLKLLLPLCAYYMVTGPWRSLWVRFGYDPRKNPDSKKYQTLDFRIRCSAKHGYSLSDMPVKAKRSSLDYTLPNTFNKTVPQPASVVELQAQDGPSTSQQPSQFGFQLKESSYIFREGMLPPHRQMFYQLCDLHVDRIRQVIHRNDGEEVDCDEKDGWCLPHTTDVLRDIISALIKKIIRAQRPKRQLYHVQRRRAGLSVRQTKVQQPVEEEDDEDYNNGEDVEEDVEDEFQLSEGSENEMESEMLDYM
ncbi:general transcription factor 3C polypeptide 5 [Lampris incognitus]|uniref:general transcription factor 3C polypeptide 5 n=1 Tax=Lampris incognitus TaxID=2546036 RepID=UPI0024B5D435|nr:general transcription factor 3C polypeptide 5 [Lampris incognitus]